MTAAIGSISFGSLTVLAPLAGITNLPFRLLAKAHGCGLVCSEMVSANGLMHGSVKTRHMLATEERERPLSVQIFGAKPDLMAGAAEMVAAAGADILDINFGCSVKKVVKTGAGVALMRQPDVAAALITAVRKAVDIPLTIKIRTGWDPSGQQAIEIARIAQGCGVDAIAVHPRTATQGFRGCADWSLIRRIKACLSIPVIGNGDITCPGDAREMMATTECDMVMIGRGAIGFPWIFDQINADLQGRPLPRIHLTDRFDAILRYLSDSVRHIGEVHACRMMRSRLGWFVKGMPHSARFRESITQLATERQFRAAIEAYRAAVLETADLKNPSDSVMDFSHNNPDRKAASSLPFPPVISPAAESACRPRIEE